jgi:hypothetical protein
MNVCICMYMYQCDCFCVLQAPARCSVAKTALSAARPKADSHPPAASSGRATMANAITSIAFLMRMVSDVARTAAAVLPKRPSNGLANQLGDGLCL